MKASLQVEGHIGFDGAACDLSGKTPPRSQADSAQSRYTAVARRQAQTPLRHTLTGLEEGQSQKALQQQTATELDAVLPSILDKAFKGEL